MGDAMEARNEDMLRFLGEQFGASSSRPGSGRCSGWIVGVVFGLPPFSAANTAVVALIGVIFMMAQDGEMPRQLARSIATACRIYPLFMAVGIPITRLASRRSLNALAGLYAIGVVGAIAVNLGSCTFNKHAGFTWYNRCSSASPF